MAQPTEKQMKAWREEAHAYRNENLDYHDSDGVDVEQVYLAGRLKGFEESQERERVLVEALEDISRTDREKGESHPLAWIARAALTAVRKKEK